MTSYNVVKLFYISYVALILPTFDIFSNLYYLFLLLPMLSNICIVDGTECPYQC